MHHFSMHLLAKNSKKYDMSHPSLSFGCANLGGSWNSKEDLDTLSGALADANVRYLDTAARYSPQSHGLSERLLGHHDFSREEFHINTKIMVQAGDGAGSMAHGAIARSISKCLKLLKLGKVSLAIAPMVEAQDSS
jgi:aryl-alcohol dehydrogenase-like predicted oxidoreductase